ncbi:DUF4124 domain-containing protein [Nitrosococcus oceani]|uniref:DUF4124 domain-containing protein n=1 Tax=Nitrosococcus oceani TaxID=1229 RepID=UPI0004E8D4D8|nr:DUF4124 domain-containing protein [Nitrosococcus oceani]KFI21661.1 hypothetical protein HW44_13670 [Nitrosococcus oceani]
MRILLLLCGLIPVITLGGIYKYVTPDGKVEYSDQPREGAVELTTMPLQTYSPPPLPKNMEAADQTKANAMVSHRLSILAPQDDATVRENTGKVEVALQVEPPLEVDSDYRLQLLLDGQSVGKTKTNLRYTLTNVDRGSHTLQAKLLDRAGAPIAHSETITFHMRRMSILFHGNNQPGGVQRAPRAPQMPRMPGPPNPGGAPTP